jgi:hypothetical protein
MSQYGGTVSTGTDASVVTHRTTVNYPHTCNVRTYVLVRTRMTYSVTSLTYIVLQCHWQGSGFFFFLQKTIVRPIAPFPRLRCNTIHFFQLNVQNMNIYKIPWLNAYTYIYINAYQQLFVDFCIKWLIIYSKCKVVNWLLIIILSSIVLVWHSWCHKTRNIRHCCKW